MTGSSPNITPVQDLATSVLEELLQDIDFEETHECYVVYENQIAIISSFDSEAQIEQIQTTIFRARFKFEDRTASVIFTNLEIDEMVTIITNLLYIK